jgi:hypothetical protein
MKKLLAAVLLGVMSLLAHGATHDDALGVEFPDRIGKLLFQQRTAFPQKALGVSYAYGLPGGWHANVYIYTAGLSRIPDSLDAPVVRQHFEQVIAEVKSLETSGQLKSVVMSGPAQITNHADCGPQFIWRGFDMNVDRGAGLARA